MKKLMLAFMLTMAALNAAEFICKINLYPADKQNPNMAIKPIDGVCFGGYYYFTKDARNYRYVHPVDRGENPKDTLVPALYYPGLDGIPYQFQCSCEENRIDFLLPNIPTPIPTPVGE